MSKDIINHFNENNIETETELILGLSEQTKESHLNDLRIVAELYIGQIVCYNCRMLEGAEMALPSEREKYGVKVKYRLVDQGFGKYKDFLSFGLFIVISLNGRLLLTRKSLIFLPSSSPTL